MEGGVGVRHWRLRAQALPGSRAARRPTLCFSRTMSCERRTKPWSRAGCTRDAASAGAPGPTLPSGLPAASAETAAGSSQAPRGCRQPTGTSHAAGTFPGRLTGPQMPEEAAGPRARGAERSLCLWGQAAGPKLLAPMPEAAGLHVLS